MSLPQTGSSDWGIALNDFIQNVVLAEANQTASAFSTHVSGAPATATVQDPHGDQAFATNLFNSITSSIGKPNGFVTLSADSVIAPKFLPTNGGMFAGTFDVQSPAYGAVPATTQAAATNQSSAIQAALTAAGEIGGGEVWLGPGFYGIGQTIVIPSGVWFHLAPGAALVQVLGTSGTFPNALVTNFAIVPVQGVASPTAGNPNILISGGTWVYSQTASPAGAAIVLADASNLVVRDAAFNLKSTGLAVILGSMSNVYITANTYLQSTTSVPGPLAVSQQAVTGATGYSFPASLASTAVCSDISVEAVDNWHGGTGQTGFIINNPSVGSTAYPSFQYTMSRDGLFVEVAGCIECPANPSGETFFILPTGYQPKFMTQYPITAAPGQTFPNAGTPGVEVDPSGSMVLRELPASLGSGTVLYVQGRFPLGAN
jgi:hypothetical protein